MSLSCSFVLLSSHPLLRYSIQIVANILARSAWFTEQEFYTSFNNRRSTASFTSFESMVLMRVNSLMALSTQIKYDNSSHSHHPTLSSLSRS